MVWVILVIMVVHGLIHAMVGLNELGLAIGLAARRQWWKRMTVIADIVSHEEL